MGKNGSNSFIMASTLILSGHLYRNEDVSRLSSKLRCRRAKQKFQRNFSFANRKTENMPKLVREIAPPNLEPTRDNREIFFERFIFREIGR